MPTSCPPPTPKVGPTCTSKELACPHTNAQRYKCIDALTHAKRKIVPVHSPRHRDTNASVDASTHAMCILTPSHAHEILQNSTRSLIEETT